MKTAETKTTVKTAAEALMAAAKATGLLKIMGMIEHSIECGHTQIEFGVDLYDTSDEEGKECMNEVLALFGGVSKKGEPFCKSLTQLFNEAKCLIPALRYLGYKVEYKGKETGNLNHYLIAWDLGFGC